MNATKRAAYLAATVMLGSSLTACGGNDFTAQSAEEIVMASVADMEALDSVRIVADVTTNGMDISLDLQLSTAGDCTGEVGIDGATAEVLRVDDQGYFRAGAAFFEQVVPDAAQAEQIVEALDGKYIEDTQGQFETFCSLEDLLENITDFNEDDEVAKGEETDLDGEDVIVIEGETDDGDPSQAFIGTGDKNYILKFATTGGDEGEATFSQFDEELDVEAPTADEIADLPGL